jgi:lysine-N-methylase
MTLNLSCPEAARKALLEEDAFEFVALDRTFRTATVSTIKPKSGVSLPVMDDVRTLVFQILRTDCLEVPARLKTIGLVCERITELLQERAVDALPGLLQTLETDLENGTLVASVEGLVERPDIQVLIASNFIRAELACPLDPHSRRLLEEVASGLEIRKGSLDAPALIAAYTLGQERLAHALGTAPKLFEHYLLNEAIRELFPWSESTPMEHYRTLVFRFAILRMLLVGRAAARAEPLTQAELVETVQVFCRLYLHVPDFSRAIEKILDGTEWKSLRKLFLLL